MKGENIGDQEKELICIVAILHDIGAVEAQKKYGSIDGVYQEKEGPAVAREILQKVGYGKNIDRICFIIGNHHTPSKIDGLDFQIQWEADLLENLTVMDKEKEQEKIKKCINDNFKTATGKMIAYERFNRFLCRFICLGIRNKIKKIPDSKKGLLLMSTLAVLYIKYLFNFNASDFI